MKRLATSLSGNLVRGSRIVRNLLIDLRSGTMLGGVYLRQPDSVNSDYYALSKIFKNRIRESDVLVDLGCGRGRVITWWQRHHPANEVIGIEIDKDIAWKARKRLRKHRNVTIISGDAIENLPENGTIFFLYNPFEIDVAEALKDRLASLFDPSQGIVLLYHNCKCLSVFENDADWTVEAVDLGGAKSAPFGELAVISMA